MTHSPVHGREPKRLLSRFMSEFGFSLALTSRQKQRVYRLRHDIYCKEIGYAAPTERTGLEFDLYDQHAIHCLIEHRRTGLVAGCTRLVMPLENAEPPLDRLPLESYGGNSLTHPHLHPAKLPKGSYYEISRLAIATPFRPRFMKHGPGDGEGPALAFSREERETFPLLLNGLFLAGYAIGDLSGKQLAFAMMEPRLSRLLSRSGFHFTRVGEAIDLYGQRSAYCIHRAQAESGMHADLRPLYRHITESLRPDLALAISGARHQVTLS